MCLKGVVDLLNLDNARWFNNYSLTIKSYSHVHAADSLALWSSKGAEVNAEFLRCKIEMNHYFGIRARYPYWIPNNRSSRLTAAIRFDRWIQNGEMASKYVVTLEEEILQALNWHQDAIDVKRSQFKDGYRENQPTNQRI